MSIGGLIEVVGDSPYLIDIMEKAADGAQEQMLVGLTGTQKSMHIAALWDLGRSGRGVMPRLVVTYSQVQAHRLQRELASLLPEGTVYLYPPWETYPHEEVTPSPEIAQSRLKALEALAHGHDALVIASVQAFCERLMPPQTYRKHTLRFETGGRQDLQEAAAQLAAMGYERSERVERPGVFAIRGGICDIFPYSRDEPVRIEFFDDEIDSIRTFDPVHQRSIGPIDAVSIGPAREWLLDPGGLSQALEAIAEAAAQQEAALRRLGRNEAADRLAARVGEHLEKIEEGVYFDGVDQYRPFFHERLATPADYLPDGGMIVDEPARARDHLDGFLRDYGERHAAQLERGRALPQEARIYADWQDVAAVWRNVPVIHISGLDKRVAGMEPREVHQVTAKTLQTFNGRIEGLAGSVREWRRKRFRICLVLSTPERGERILEALRDEGMEAHRLASLNGALNGQFPAGHVVIATGSLEGGFELPDQRLVVLTDAEVFGRPKRRRPRAAERTDAGVRIDSFGDLKEGDYVVHVNHGIGKYVGMETLEIGGAHKDYLVVQYAGEDRLYVPTDQVDLLQRYVGVEGHAPRLYKLGGNEWNRVKKKVRESVQEIADGLLKLYAERETLTGHAFGPDTVWQQEFEDAFPYEETPDQLRAIEEVKRDMERPRPMDRLLCGDVGFGKTEVALRAAFKAVADGRQVAVLVPTTILAQQHGRTFEERLAPYPVKVAVLSRFQSQREQTEIIKGLRQGSIDVVVGTHRLLSKDLEFKDLGLVVVDEEQRFGVVQKERLKELRKSVDVLTLSATPIPRTLHMAMVGVRDMSLIETPPEDRFPIRTYVIEYDEAVIREAIQRELAREGQVYFVYNRVQRIEQMHERLSALVPEARIAIAHGQMDEERLERVMLEFLQGEYDILLCSTIIETGMDIANVNTLIVYDADRMGLAQLYQLRGRVGRSNRVAYAYFTYRKEKILGEDAEKRLQAIKELTDLGSGFKIALRDLEIRGAGNILGAEQHGHIASVGFELYCKLLEESIKELKGAVEPQPPDPVIDLQLDAYIPDSYVSDSQQKVELYKKVIAARDFADVQELEEEFADRFGPPPPPALALLGVARLKCLARTLGVAQITQERDLLTVKFLPGVALRKEAGARIVRTFKGRAQLAPGRAPVARLRARGMDDAERLQALEQLLRLLEP